MDVANFARSIPVSGEYDVVVGGGGIAGFGAACAAARHGAKTLLIERLEILGGLGSSGGVGNFCYGDDTLPLAHGRVFDEIWAKLAQLGAIEVENGWRIGRSKLFHNHTFDHNILPIVLQRLALQHGVDLLFATDIAGAIVDDGTMTHAVIHNRSLLQAVAARVFIDATGDGILAQHAGAPVLPPDPEHPECIPPSMMIFVGKSSKPHEEAAPQQAPGPINYSVWAEPDRIGLKMKMNEQTFDTRTGAGYSQANMAFRDRMLDHVRHFRQRSGYEDYDFAYAAAMFGIREGNRIEGDYVMTAEDVRSHRRFDDAVAFGCFPFDSARMKLSKMPPYTIPYRSLLVRNLANVLVAGRCFSGTTLAVSSTRVMPTGCLMGQAAGIAAAGAVSAGCSIREIEAAHVRDALVDGAHGAEIMQERMQPATRST